jgi:DNA glycosylase AlkZ-like
VPGANGMFKPIIVIDGRVVGTWQRTLRKNAVLIAPSPFRVLSKAEERAFVKAAEQYGTFLNLPVAVTL